MRKIQWSIFLGLGSCLVAWTIWTTPPAGSPAYTWDFDQCVVSARLNGGLGESCGINRRQGFETSEYLDFQFEKQAQLPKSEFDYLRGMGIFVDILKLEPKPLR